MYYVYQLIDPGTNNVFYVGKGKGYRMMDHVYTVRNNLKYRSRNRHLYNKIAKIMANGSEVICKKVFENENETTVLEHEKALIKQIGLDNLTNLTPGGEGYTRSPTEEHRRKISLALKGRPSPKRGCRLSEETKRKMSAAKQGKVFSQEHKAAMSKAALGKPKPWLRKQH